MAEEKKYKNLISTYDSNIQKHSDFEIEINTFMKNCVSRFTRDFNFPRNKIEYNIKYPKYLTAEIKVKFSFPLKNSTKSISFTISIYAVHESGRDIKIKNIREEDLFCVHYLKYDFSDLCDSLYCLLSQDLSIY